MGISRRTVLQSAAVVTVPAIPAETDEPVFAHGVASGDPLPGSVLLWTRVTPTPDSVPGSAQGPKVDVRWELATDAEFDCVVARGLARTGPDRDHTVKVIADGLRPATPYFYRFACQGVQSPIGRTLTAPRREAEPASLRFGVVSCANWSVGYFAAYRYLAERDDLAAVIHLGDYLYEGTPSPKDLRQVQPPHELVTLADYRVRHAMYKTDEHVQRMHARHPMIATWDDHESADNAWSGGSPSHDPATEGDWATRAKGAHQAYFEWMPVRHSGPQLYRRFRFGKLIDLAMLDLRSYRTQQPTPGTVDPAGTILGADQRQWLVDGLARGTATWNLIGNSVMMAPLAVPTNQGLATTINPDQWDGYPTDRRTVLDAIAAQGRSNTVFLTGDIHSSWAINVPRDPANPRSEPVAAEFVCTSITSDNFDELQGVPPRTGSLVLEAAIRALNPHVQYVELDSHGPSLLEVTPSAVQMDWYYVADKTDPAAAVSYARSFRTALGDPRVVTAADPI